jgi:hypothetical protein
MASTLADGSEVYQVIDSKLVPALVRVLARRKSLVAGQATFGRSVSKTEWVYGCPPRSQPTPSGSFLNAYLDRALRHSADLLA